MCPVVVIGRVVCVPFPSSPCSAQLSLEVDHKSYALIFGFNTFLALILQTILTLIVADEHGLALDIPTQVSHRSSACQTKPSLLLSCLSGVVCGVQWLLLCPDSGLSLRGRVQADLGGMVPQLPQMLAASPRNFRGRHTIGATQRHPSSRRRRNKIKWN